MKKKILTTIIALNILITTLTGCLNRGNINTNKEENNSKTDASFSVPETPSSDRVVNPETEEEMDITYDTPSNYEGITLSEADLNFLSQNMIGEFGNVADDISNIKTEYLYSELYTAKHNLNINYVATNDTDIIINNQVNYDALYNKVLVNNASYMAENNITNYKNTTDSLVARVCKLIVTEINDLLTDNTTIDRIALNHKLNDLKIFSYVSYSYGLYNQENGVLAINEQTLNSYGTDITSSVIGHEIAHLVQSASTEELENADYLERFGYCYKTSDDTFNPYNWTWFIEAAAEDYSYKFYNLDEPFVYPTEIKTIETMRLATFNTGDEFSDSLYSSDINTLYNLFGCQTDEEKEEIQRMFYGFTINYNDSPGQEGDNFYKTLHAELGTEEYTRVQTEIKGSSCLTLSKVFYKNLASKINGQSVKLEDVFKVISIYELEMSRQLWYQSKYADLEIFLTGYTEVQNAFFATLATNMGVELDYIKELYYAYNNEIEITDVNIPWLTSDENAYLEYVNSSRVGNKKDAIFKVYEDNFGLGVNR